MLCLQSKWAGNCIRIRQKSHLFVSELSDFHAVLFLDFFFILYYHIATNINYTKQEKLPITPCSASGIYIIPIHLNPFDPTQTKISAISMVFCSWTSFFILYYHIAININYTEQEKFPITPCSASGIYIIPIH